MSGPGPLKWGFFGAGRITSDFVNSISTLSKTKHLPVAIAARDLRRAQEFASKTKLPKAYGKYEELAADPGIDIIYIGTVNSEHYEQIKLALGSGKHILCEKPLCLNAWQTREVVALARARKLFLMEGYWTRFFPAYEYFDELIKSGVIGDVNLTVSAYAQYTDNYRLHTRELGGGVTLSYGCYGIAYATHMFGKPDKIVACGHMNGDAVDVTSVVNLLYNDGQKTATIISSSRLKSPGFDACGPKGVIRLLDYGFAPIKVQIPDGTIKDFDVPSLDCETYYPYSTGFTFEAEEIRKSIQNGKLESDRMPLDESILISEIMDEIRKQLGVSYPQDKQ